MFRRLRMRFARKRDAKKVAKLFSEIDADFDLAELADLIGERKVVLLRDRKKTMGAFSFVKLGLGIFTVLYIRKLVVARKFRGKGLGSKVLQKLRCFTRRKKANGFFLWALPKAKRFYQKNRLQNIGRLFWWNR